MKIGRFNFDIPELGRINMEDVDCSTEEFKVLLETALKLQKAEMERTKMLQLPLKPAE